MSARWFRFHADAMRNPKVARLTDAQFRLWVELMSVAAENDGHIPCLDDLKHLLKRRLDHLSRGLDDLISASLIDPLDVGYEPHNWNKFQYKSDTSTDRVHKHRAKRNVSETPPDTETDTEGVEAKASPPPRARRAAASGCSRMTADWVPGPLPADVAALVALWPPGRVEREAAATRDYWLTRNTKRPGWDLTFHNRIRDVHDRVLKDNCHGQQPNRNPVSPDRRDGIARALDRRLGLDEAPGPVGRSTISPSEGDSGFPVARLAAVR